MTSSVCPRRQEELENHSGAGLMVTALLMNEVPWAEFLFIGPTQEKPRFGLQ